MQEIYPLLANADVLVWASPIYYLTFSSQLHAVIQRRAMTVMQRPGKKKMALMLSSNSPGVFDASILQYQQLCGYWQFEDTGIVTASNDEQKTEETKQKIIEIVSKL